MSDSFTPSVAPLLPPSPTAHWFICGADGLLVVESEGQTQLPTREQLSDLGLAIECAHYLGRLAETDCFALAFPGGAAGKSGRPALPAGLAVRGLRKLYGVLADELFAIAGRAAQIAVWDETHQFCGRCGARVERQSHERAKRCPACELTVFPRLSPAVIVLVRKGSQALLARSARFPIPMYSTLAGFVEPGESLEQTVAREIREEAGIEVTNLRYFGSQSWPFPHSLMVGFLAEYAGGELRPDGEELIDARWFDAHELPPIPPRLSIARQLIDSWLAEHHVAS